jgi:hypothetical protein
MPSGKLRKRAGIESLAYAAEGEDEVALGIRAAELALQRSSVWGRLALLNAGLWRVWTCNFSLHGCLGRPS